MSTRGEMQTETTQVLIGMAVISIFFCGVLGGQAAADQRELIVSLAASEEYNDNIFFTFDDEVDDFITTLSGGLAFINNTERSNLSLSGRLERLIYADEKDLDATDQYYSGTFNYRLTERLGAGVEAAYTKDSRPDRDVATTGLILSTVPRQIQNYRGSVNYALTEITTSNLFYRYTRRDFEPRSADRSFDDYRAHRAGLGFAHRLDQYLANTTGRLNFGYNRFKYTETNTETEVFYGTAGLLRELTEKWRILIDLGPNYYESKFQVFGDNFTNRGWGVTGLVDLTYTGEYTGTTFTLMHGIEPASGRLGSSQRTSAIIKMFYRFAERGRAGLSAGYYVNKADAGDLTLLPVDEDTLNFRPWLRFDIIFNKLYLEASYTYSRIKDKEVDDTRDRNLVWLKLVFDYPAIQ